MKRNAKDTKELILNTAIKLFAKHGFDGLRVDEIAATAKVNKATIYYHFKDKSFIFETIIIYMTDKIQEEINRRQASTSSPMEKLVAFLDAIIFIVTTQRDLAKIMMQELAFNGKNLSLGLKRRFLIIFEVLKDIVQRGAELGEFKPVDPLLVHAVLLGGMNYYLSMKESIDSDLLIAFETEPENVLKNMILNYLKR
jgi:AcrR family transcriptional regulator